MQRNLVLDAGNPQLRCGADTDVAEQRRAFFWAGRLLMSSCLLRPDCSEGLQCFWNLIPLKLPSMVKHKETDHCEWLNTLQLKEPDYHAIFAYFSLYILFTIFWWHLFYSLFKASLYKATYTHLTSNCFLVLHGDQIQQNAWENTMLV